MRVIKFRAYNDKLKHMYYPEDNDKEPNLWNLKNFVDGGRLINDVIDILMQYTGLKDKNGKEIYEGDIVRATLNEWDCDRDGDGGFAEKTIYGVVKINPTRTRMKVIKVECEDEDLEPHYLIGKLMQIKTKYDEVIGNIYENPELLNH